MLSQSNSLWDFSDMSGDEPLRGQALYEALMRLKPARMAETDWAASAGVNRGFFTNLKGSNILPRTDNLRKLLTHIGRTEGDLYGAAPTSERAVPAGSTGSTADDDVEIDSVDLAYGMGGTFLDLDAEVERVRFSRAWLRNFTDTPPEKLGIAQGLGDSMEPMIHDRDLVLFDRSARLNDHMSDKTWVFAFGQVGMIKRLRPMPDGTVKIMSANRTYPDETASMTDLHIIGRVVASIRRH